MREYYASHSVRLRHASRRVSYPLVDPPSLSPRPSLSIFCLSPPFTLLSLFFPSFSVFTGSFCLSVYPCESHPFLHCCLFSPLLLLYFLHTFPRPAIYTFLLLIVSSFSFFLFFSFPTFPLFLFILSFHFNFLLLLLLHSLHFLSIPFTTPPLRLRLLLLYLNFPISLVFLV